MTDDDKTGPGSNVISIASSGPKPGFELVTPEVAKNIAAMRRKLFLAYREQGFDERQALELCCK